MFGLFALPFGRAVAFVLEEFREMFAVDVFPIIKADSLGPVDKPAEQRGIGLLRLGRLTLFEADVLQKIVYRGVHRA